MSLKKKSIISIGKYLCVKLPNWFYTYGKKKNCQENIRKSFMKINIAGCSEKSIYNVKEESVSK